MTLFHLENLILDTVHCSFFMFSKNIFKLFFNLRRCRQERFLFTDKSLGLTDFDIFRNARRRKLNISQEQFWNRMQHYFLPNNTLFIYTEDLKNAVCLAETEEQIHIVTKMCYRYNDQSQRMKIFIYQFGSVIMRMLHCAKKPDLAYDLISDPALSNFFNHPMCFTVCMDLLYKEERYQAIIDVWKIYENSDCMLKNPYPRSLQILTTAACYKMATEEACEFGLQFLGNCITKVPVPGKALAMMSALCLKIENPNMSYEILMLMKKPEDNVLSRGLLCYALKNLNRLHEAIQLLEQLIVTDLSSPTTDFKISACVLEDLSKAVGEMADTNLIKRFKRVHSQLKQSNNIIITSIDDLLCAPVHMQPSSQQEDTSLQGDPLNSNNTSQNASTQSAILHKNRSYTSDKIVELLAKRIRSEGPYEN
ncbi:hypothetical protein Tsp_10015 [Trichinella spiralis]|uniref:Pentatricopeptide repeat-containing protein 2, mitochondrial n=1 Tax=Trichinella spiralis TaxID=6334 RepID=E5SKN5_TRISP|nr:hypothetical protein Tsp_10015 [Trichinella spiralis]KRY34728.1 Pentatricopeptide repeat-containing protein 2, mitochondrial [Trichinella spiralis]